MRQDDATLLDIAKAARLITPAVMKQAMVGEGRVSMFGKMPAFWERANRVDSL